MEKTIKILAINPGSTSTKVGVFENEKEIFSANITHDAEKLKEFKEVQDQLDYRSKVVEEELVNAGIDLNTIDVFVGRGGGLVPIEGGVYKVTERLLQDARIGTSGQHPAQLASQICARFVEKYKGEAFVVNPPDTDEFHDLARVTCLKGLYRESRIHALNQKEIALRYCKEKNLSYDDINLIICHLGGGISVTAHHKGKMIDSNDIINGEGSMTPTRVGALPTVKLLKLCFSGKYTEKELYTKLTKNGGLIDHLGTSDAREVEKRISEGDKYAKLVYDAMIYQIGKEVGSMAVVLKGKVDGIILTGGMSHSDYIVSTLKEYVSWIGPITVMAGEFEMEALAAGALRVMRGGEEAKEYTGIPVWQGFDF